MGPIVQHLLVGTYNFTVGTPPNLCIVVVGQSFFGHIVVYRIPPLSFNFCRYLQFVDGTSLLKLLIEPGVVKPDKNPLRPLKIARIGSVYLPVPIIAQSQRLYLPAKIIAIFLGCDGRLGTGLNGILLCR